MEFIFRNVNDAFTRLVGIFDDRATGKVKYTSRLGPVRAIPEPVMVTYLRPKERVLFNPARNANPFFSFYESLWMLAGHDNVDELSYYCSRMKNYSDDGTKLNGAYGKRWRRAIAGVDQLTLLVEHLKTTPNSRRAVLQMWNVEKDLLKIDQSSDICCNTSVMFSSREAPFTEGRALDITVTSRSNDLILGLLGNDYVVFSMLQEYMARQLNLPIGKYYHFTNNLHVYEDNFEPEAWLNESLFDGRTVNQYSNRGWEWRHAPLVNSPEVFEKELTEFVTRHGKNAMAIDYQEPFLAEVAQPMCIAYHHYKQEDLKGALQVIKKVAADDWRLAATSWLERRLLKRSKSEVTT